MARSHSDIQDELLVLRCRRGDAGAWDELARRYNDRLWYYVQRFIDDPDRAAQVLQDIWIHVLRGLSRLQQPDRLAPWLYTIARRTVMSDYRQKYAAMEQLPQVPLEDIVDEESTIMTQFENAEWVHHGLKQIGWAEREVLTLFFLNDLSIAEIGRVLEIPPGTVKSRLSRARAELRQVLAEQAQASHAADHLKKVDG